jgi:inner membrane protein
MGGCELRPSQPSRQSDRDCSEYHHVFAHNLGFVLFVTVIAALIAARRSATACLAILVLHLHLLADLVGSRGPDGYQWPIPYLRPFSDAWQLTWEGQWVLNAWPNIVITILLLCWTFYWAWSRGRSPLEMISLRIDDVLVSTLRKRFGEPVS